MNKLLHGTCYYPELWPESDQERDIAAMKKVGLNMVRIGEFTWSKMEPEEGRISVDFFLRVLDRLHAAGIGVVYCTPTPTPPVWLTHGRPDRCFVDAEGRVMSHGARQHASYEHPVVRAACLRIVETLAAAVGRHPAIIAWQIDNEFKCHVGEDFNPHAVAHWHRWLEARYGTIDRLNDAWGTEIWSERYQRFDQVPAPVRTPFLHNASLSTAYRMFCRESIAEFMDAQCTVIRRHSDKPITHNTVTFFSVNHERLFANLDFASFDDYPSRDNWPAIVFDNDLCRPVKPGRAHWFMETSVAHNGWFGNHEVTHPPGFLAAEAVVSFGLGAQAINYWLWRQQRTGCELPHSAILSTWYRPSVGYTAVEAVEAARRQLEPLMVASRPAVPEAAVTWSDLGRAMLQTEPLGGRPGHEVDYVQSVMQWHRLLLDAGIHRDVRFEGAPLDGLKLLVTPMMPYVSPHFLAKVEKFVRAGGVWICAPTTGTRAAEHTVPTEAGLGAVDALAGVTTVFSFPITGTGSTGRAFGVTAPVGGWCSALRPAGPATKVVGLLRSEQAPGLAFLTERRVGKGAVVVLGALPDGKAGAKLLAKLVAHYAKQAGVTLRFDASPGTVVCPRATADGKALWVVVNLDGKGGRVRLPKGATDALTGRRLPAGSLPVGRYRWRAVWLG
jgi:beta-galactosidase